MLRQKSPLDQRRYSTSAVQMDVGTVQPFLDSNAVIFLYGSLKMVDVWTAEEQDFGSCA